MQHNEYSFDELSKRYEAMTVCAQASCHLVTDLVGGMPGNRAGVEMFVRYQLGLEGEEAKNAVDRIMTHELEGGTRVIDLPEGSELTEAETKQVNLIRRDEHGPWLGDWMVKACLKNAASRIGLFVDKRGSKGAMAEMGQARAYGPSLFERDERYNANRIYLRIGEGPAPTAMEFIKGRVSSPQGSKSIVTLAETCPAGAEFSFEYRFYNDNISDDDIVDFFAASMVIGLGSARSFERGKFRIDRLTVDRGDKRKKSKLEKQVTEKADAAEVVA